MAQRRRRRDPDKERFWRQAIRRQQKSELTVSAFCAAEGLKDWSFHWWRRELVKRDRENPAAKPRRVPSFASVQLLPERGEQRDPGTIEIVVTSGQRVRIPAGFDPQTLASVLGVLERQPC
jgi:hypothetical protein